MRAVAQSAADRAIPAAAVCDEHALVGRRVLKKFKGYGTHAGTVVAHLPAERTHGAFLIHYEDGDTERMAAAQLERWLQPIARVALPSVYRPRTRQLDRRSASTANSSSDTSSTSSCITASARSGPSCLVCLSTFGELPPATPVVQLPRCEHLFCRDCIEGWWLSSSANSCPACRTVYSSIRRCAVLTAGAVLAAEPSILALVVNGDHQPATATVLGPAAAAVAKLAKSRQRAAFARHFFADLVKGDVLAYRETVTALPDDGQESAWRPQHQLQSAVQSTQSLQLSNHELS